MPDIDEGQYVSIRTSRFNPSPDAPWDLVNDRFNQSMTTADELLEILIGASGDSGILGDFKDLLDLLYTTYDIDPPDDVDTSLTVGDIGDAPQFNDALIDDFPSFSASDPALLDIPTIDLADLALPEEPDDINPQIVWSELILNRDVYDSLLERINRDILDGATGLSAEVQEDIFNSGRERQRRANDLAYRQLNNDLAGRGALVPAGVVFGALTELQAEQLAQDSELNRTITIEQAQLAQNNSQFIIDQTRQLETLLRDTRHKDSDRALDYAKSVAQLTIQLYSEKVRMYITIVEAKKMYIEAQVANLQGIVSHNMALIEQYKAILQAHGIQVEAISMKNKSLVDVYNGKIQGYAAEASATATLDQVRLDRIKLDVAEADLNLRHAIANIEQKVRTKETHDNLKARVTESLAQVASNAFVGALSSVHANASMAYQGSESRSESYGQSKSLSETHNYQEDPEVT